MEVIMTRLLTKKQTIGLILMLSISQTHAGPENLSKVFSKLCSAINFGASYYPALQGALGLVGCGYTYLVLNSSPHKLLSLVSPKHDVTEYYPRTVALLQDMTEQKNNNPQPKIIITKLNPQGMAFLGIMALFSSSCGIKGELFIPENIAQTIEEKTGKDPKARLIGLSLTLDHQKMLQEHGKTAVAMLAIPLTSNYVLKKVTQYYASAVICPKKVPAFILSALKIPAGFGKLLESLTLLHYYNTYRHRLPEEKKPEKKCCHAHLQIHRL
jgi:hypothetical protein